MMRFEAIGKEIIFYTLTKYNTQKFINQNVKSNYLWNSMLLLVYISNIVSKILKCLDRKVYKSSNPYIHEKKNV